MDETEALNALEMVDARLRPGAPLRAVIAGAMAGVLSHLFEGGRMTADCDVVAMDPFASTEEVLAAAREVAAELGLPSRWLNTDCSVFAHLLPLGWRKRIVVVKRFGRLEICVISRRDLLVMKVVGAANSRPQDLDDALALRPDSEDIDFVEQNIERLEAEGLDGREWNGERAIVTKLRKEPR